MTDANGGTTSYAYDEMGRMIEEISPLGSRHRYTYNAEGLLAELENARGQKTSYTYDAIGRVTSMTDELGTVSYTYDNNGNVLTVSDKQGTITRKYDALNRVTEYTDYQGNTIKYSYDELGNLIALTYPGGEIVRYTYYKNGLVHTVTGHNGEVTTYEYDKRGNLTHTIRPNGTEEICTYNAAGMLISQRDVKSEEVLTCYNYEYDAYGNITTVEGTETTDTKEGLSRLSSAVMTYDGENKLLTYNGEALRYDADGNMTYGPVNGVMSELTYDCRNRLISAGGITYRYDAENNRIKAEADTYTEEYVTDTVSSSLSRVLTMTRTEKGSATGTAESTTKKSTTLYVYGQGLICEETAGMYLYHHYNNLGSTMKLSNAVGQVVATYTYGTYGELLSGDTTLTRFLYNGRCGVTTDDNGLYYMRQRYYNPEIKRFVNQDILTGSLDNSQSLNRYSYVQGNPVSYTDPFGLSPINGLFSGTGFAHAVLGLLGCIPGPAGAVFDLVDAAIYAFVDHDYGMAALSLLSAVAGSAPIAAGKFMKIAESSSDILTASKYAKMARGARYVETGANLVNNTVNFARNGSMAVQNASAMYKKHENGQDITAGDWLSLGMNVLGCAISGGQMAGNTLKLGRMMSEDGVGARLKAEMSSFANNPKCYIQGGNKCFVAGTKIKTIDGYKNIEDIEEGDLVYAQNEETGETGYKEVVTLFRNEATELTHVQIGDNAIITTPTHPFWVEGYGFKAAGELKAGDLVQTAEGELLTVTGIEKEYLAEPITVYNFEVADWHTYYVSEDEVLVHNMCPVGMKGGTPSTADRIRNVAQQSFDYAVNNPRKQGLNRMQLGKDAEIQATRWTRKWAERNGIDLSESGLHFQVRGEHSIPDVVYEPTKNIMDFKLTPKAVRKKQSDNFKSDFPGYSIEYIFGPGPWRE